MPNVDSVLEARELVATQDNNPNLDTDEMPFDHTHEPPTSSIEPLVRDEEPEQLTV